MTVLEIILLVCTVALLGLCIVLIINYKGLRKDANVLIESIDDFIENGTATDFSVKDNNFSRLQNGVADLENLIRLEKSNTLAQTRKNTEFISDISHQLKTPLSGLRLYCEMENAENPSVHTEKELQLVERMEKLIRNLLKLEKIKSDAYVMDFKTWEVRDIVNETLAEFHHLFPQKTYNVIGNGELRCDKAWLCEAFGNIIKNASEHTAQDGIVTVKIENHNHSTIVEISDNGGGIADAELPNLFVRFYRCENASPNSAGIGLAITKAIVEKHHGIISAENKNNGLSVNMCFAHIEGYETI